MATLHSSPSLGGKYASPTLRPAAPCCLRTPCGVRTAAYTIPSARPGAILTITISSGTSRDGVIDGNRRTPPTRPRLTSQEEKHPNLACPQRLHRHESCVAHRRVAAADGRLGLGAADRTCE